MSKIINEASQMSQDKEKETKPFISQKVINRSGKKNNFFKSVLRLLLTACVFGAVAGFVFAVVSPWAKGLSKSELPTETKPPIKLPSFSEVATSPSTTTTEAVTTTETSPTSENAQNLQEIIQMLIDRNQIDLSDVEQHYKLIRHIYENINKTLVSIQGASNEIGLFESPAQAITGIIFYKTEQELIIIADGEAIDQIGTEIKVEFPNLNLEVDGYIKGIDSIFNIAVVAVDITNFDDSVLEKIAVAYIGNTFLIKPGDPVVMVGSPYGINYSYAFGNITAIEKDQITVDSLYRLIYTNTIIPQNGNGFMLNMNGELIGILTKQFKKDGLQDYAASIGIPEIKDLLTRLANHSGNTYLGIEARDITKNMAETSQIPEGAYVTAVVLDSPAYAAGIRGGDVIVGISTTPIHTLAELNSVLINDNKPGETVVITVMREGREGFKEIECSTTLGTRLK